MYLAALGIEGFRKLNTLELRFCPGLNILVGPNNVGKTAVVDALRALLSATDEGVLRIDDYDLHINASGGKSSEITFHYVFRGLTIEDEADLYAALRPLPPVKDQETEYEAHLHLRYSQSNGRLRVQRWCGEHEENQVTSDMLEELRAVYLPPLRDPASGLRPSRTSQLARLIHRLADDDAKTELENALKLFEDDLQKKGPVADTQAAVSNRHQAMLGDQLKQLLKVGLTPPGFQRLAARLALVVENLDVEQNGLGFNNLIYMAVVLSELALNPDAAYKALIVEEPEAHLHPQLQAILLQYLQSKEIPNENEKAVQVFVTSHSPNFASIASLDSISCVHLGTDGVRAFFPREVEFAGNKKRKLQRYLDVTRAELFFARRIILVEGTGELFIVNALAAKLGIDLRLHSVSILSTEGLNFDCFLPLFGSGALHVPVALITDADPVQPGSADEIVLDADLADPAKGDGEVAKKESSQKRPKLYPKLGEKQVLSATAKKLKDNESDFVKVFLAQQTLEYDLALQPANQVPILQALAEMHPIIAKALKEKVDLSPTENKPEVLFRGIFEREKGETKVQKGAFAQALALVIADPGVAFEAPPYILNALNFVTGKETSEDDILKPKSADKVDVDVPADR